MESTALKLEVVPFSPFVMVPFWHTLSKKKLEEYKLDDSEKEILGVYKVNNYKENRANLYFDSNSLVETVKTVGQIEIKINGYLKNCNTAEGYETDDKFTLFEQKSLEFYEALKDIAENPEKHDRISTLNTFFMVTFADLKHHLFKFAVASPIFKTEKVKIAARKTFGTAFEAKDLENFEAGLKEFLLKEQETPSILFVEYKEAAFNFFSSPATYFEKSEDKDTQVFALIIDSYNQENKYGEPVYNFILMNLLRKAAGKRNNQIIKILALKDFIVPNSQAKVTWARSQIVEVDISQASVPEGKPKILTVNSLKENKVVDLKTQLDERSLSTMAVDLNIKLMKWRLLPELNIERVQKVKCLLFGSGTLGCQLARNLLGWGIRTITFIDYGRVTHSNPVRQSLFDFEDAQNGGKPKAETAAAKLTKIFPEVNSRGYSLEIPMPGHYAQSEEKQQKVIETLDTLEQLVSEHDVVFLLTDNRESRWLPTVLANKYNKICITVGLGFDSYVVVRQGISAAIHNQEIHGERLGCYFCNDILSPHNSMKDRTLDQQCTVTRPGLSYISSAFASELLVSLLHHPAGVGAPAYDPQAKNNEETCLGYLPQYLRGSCSEFDSRVFVSNAFPNCVACSDFVLTEFNNDRNNFMFRVMNNPDYLHSVTKIDDILKETEEGIDIIEDDDF